MKFTISSKKLFTKLQAAAQVINKKNTRPILDCLLLELRENILHIAATDGEIRLLTKVEVENAQGDEKIAVNARNLVDALKELPDQPVTVEINKDTFMVFIHYHNGKFNFIAQNADEYPTAKPLDKKVKQEFVIDQNVLMSGISGTLVAVANDEFRPIMNGCYINITKDNLTFVSSDGYRLIKLVNFETKGSDKASFVLPTKGANILKYLLAKQTELIRIKFDFNQATFELTDYSLTICFVEGRYPNYESVIPHNNPTRFAISKSELSDIIKRVSVFANQSSNLVKFDIQNNTLTVSAQDIDISTAAEENIGIDYNGSPMSIGFKYSFLLELLDNIHSPEVEIQLSDPNKAALIVPTINNSGWDSTILLMPMKLND